MRLTHFEDLRPICPVCRQRDSAAVSRLKLMRILAQTPDFIREGLLVCGDPECSCEFPIIDGIPLIVPNVSDYVERNRASILTRSDLRAATEGVIGDCLGPESEWESTRQHLSTYVWDHYGEFDTPIESAMSAPGSVVRLLSGARDILPRKITGRTADLGCSVGRTSFELAQQTQELVLGVDYSFAMLRLAQDILQTNEVAYSKRRTGLAYERRRFPVHFPAAKHVDFWACDATALPFEEHTFSHVNSLNLLDSISSPSEHLRSISTVIATEGEAVIACPYDWTPSATPVVGWIGGHSDRAEDLGSPVDRLRFLLTERDTDVGLRLLSEHDELTWTVRLHDRSFLTYQVHMVCARKCKFDASSSRDSAMD